MWRSSAYGWHVWWKFLLPFLLLLHLQRRWKCLLKLLLQYISIFWKLSPSTQAELVKNTYNKYVVYDAMFHLNFHICMLRITILNTSSSYDEEPCISFIITKYITLLRQGLFFIKNKKWNSSLQKAELFIAPHNHSIPIFLFWRCDKKCSKHVNKGDTKEELHVIYFNCFDLNYVYFS